MSSNWRPRAQLRSGIRPGEWLMFDGGQKIAIVRALELGPNRTLMFRSVTYAEASADRILIGYFPNLDMAADMTWREWMRARGQLDEPMR